MAWLLAASVLLAACGCRGLILSARGRWTGWAVNLTVHSTWAVLAVISHDVNRFVPSLMYASVYGRNALRWKRRQPHFDDGPLRDALGRLLDTAGCPVYVRQAAATWLNDKETP